MTFDVEEYRADLERRRDTLRRRAGQYYQKYSGGKHQGDLSDSLRCDHKADGIDIALSLLPEPGGFAMDKVNRIEPNVNTGGATGRHTFVSFEMGGICSCGVFTGVIPNLREE